MTLAQSVLRRGRISGKFLLILISVIGLAACGTGSTAATPASPIPSIHFAMIDQNGSGVSGTGTVVKADGSFTVTIRLTKMLVGSSHVSHIHAGRCAAPGGIAFALQQVIADASGSATTASTLPVTYSLPASGWYVNVHEGPDFTEPEYAPSISCGDLPAA
ncbi:MAG TPA: CHRD domain-containing protein [Candidatus Dormibacteraeota bacterium]